MKTTITRSVSTVMAAVALCVVAILMTSTASAMEFPLDFASEIQIYAMATNGIAVADGKVSGYSYGGLFWTADEYADMTGLNRAGDESVISEDEQLDVGINEVFGLNLTAEELKQLSDGISLVTADSEDESSSEATANAEAVTAMSVEVDAETGEKTISLDGYTFKVDKDTEMNSVLRRLGKWDLEKSPYAAQFFSENWTYKTVHVEDGAQNIIVDAENREIAFGVNASIDELSNWEVLAMYRLSVIKDQKTEEKKAK